MKVLPWALTVLVATSLNTRVDAFCPKSPVVGVRQSITGTSSRTTILARQTSPVTTESDIDQPKDFVNNGPMAWMQEFLDLAGVVPGQTIAYGPFTTGIVPESNRKSMTEAAMLRDEAARNLQNIDKDERTRRLEASKIMTLLTAIYAVWAALVGDQGDLVGHLLRFATVFPLFLAVGYRLSAETGL